MNPYFKENKILARQWRMLFIYNIYRLVSIGALFILFLIYTSKDQTTYKIYYSQAFIFYFLFGFLFLHLCNKRLLKFELQVLWAGTIDIILMVFFIHAIGYIESGLGVILFVTIAMLSILVPGRLAIYFAAIASSLFLTIALIHYFNGQHVGLSRFFSSGIYGVGFFGTALTAWYLASWVHSSEDLARYRARELASMRKLNEYIVDRLHHGIIFVTQGKIKLMNSAAREFFNIPKEKGDLILENFSSELNKQYQKFISKPLESDITVQAELQNPYLQVNFFPAEYADRTAAIITLEDMTELSQQVQQMKLASLGKFSASIAHELRNPLGIIAHAIQLMGEGDKLDSEDEHLKQLILKNCQRMNRVIKNVLQISRRESSNPETIKINTFLKQFKKDFMLINSCKLDIKVPKGQHLVVFDRSQLEQILVILCDNAMQHGKNAKGKVNISIVYEQYMNIKRIHVCDDGSGISPENRATIFDPFFSTLRTGNGMGLYIAKDLCEVNQAQLTLEESKSGSHFLLTLKQNKEIML
jgi:two-component system sensor histidine kinase PilS (NtrC family)